MTMYVAGQIINDQNLNANGAQVDSTQFTVTQTTPTRASALWDIGPFVAAAGSTWRITVMWQSITGASARSMEWVIGYGPGGVSQQFIATTGGGLPNQPASSTWFGTCNIWLMVLTSGAAGTALLIGRTDAGQVPNNSVVAGWVGGSIVKFNTTTDNGLCLLFNYDATTNSPTFTSFCSTFERLS